MEIDFGEALGIKKSSAQITQLYDTKSLLGKQILAVVNLPPKQIADYISEVLILGVYGKDGVVLIIPEQRVETGVQLG